jgi:hypothetical protein
MQRKRVALFEVILILLGLQQVGCQEPQEPDQFARPDVAVVEPGITSEAIRAHIAFLADDALEGRGTGSRGYDLAAKYIRAQLIASHISGGAGNGEYFQEVPFIRTKVDADGTMMTIGSSSNLEYGSDFLMLDTHRELTGEASGNVIYVGYGVTAPELDYDDYSSLEVEGAIVAFLEFEAPPAFPPTIRAYYADHDVKTAIAVEHGAAGVLYIRSPETEKRFPWDFLRRELDIGWNSLRWLRRDDTPGGMTETALLVGDLSRSGAEVLFDGEEQSLSSVFEAAEKGQPSSFTLSKNVTMQYRAQHEKITSVNIIGFLEGSDPLLKNEFVVYTAHADHLGIGPEIDGDSIYNGAMDNASGCAVLLEVARAFGASAVRPKRSILFVFVTGEEASLLGADFFVHNPPVPIEHIVANINIDGGISLTPVNSVVAYGAEHSSFDSLIQSTADNLELAVSPDPFPEEGLFVRSDQFPFIKKGVPAVFLSTGFESNVPNVDPVESLKEWLVTNYHSPKDDTSQPLDYESSEKLSKFAFALGHDIAMKPQRPRWNETDFFGDRFAN